MARRIYFDNNATTRMRTEVIEAVMPCFDRYFGNASSMHLFGQEASGILDQSRTEVAGLVGAETDEIVFTSGGTESDNMAIRGFINPYLRKGLKPHIITSSIEHPAVLRTCMRLEKEGVEVDYLPCGRDGGVLLSELEGTIGKGTVLVSVMLANNETGVIQPISEISEIVRRHGVIFHVDAVQGVGKIPVNVDRLGVDMLSISAHKFHGPKGIGALYIRRGTPLEPVSSGGHHENGLRPGTENIPAIAGFAAASRISSERIRAEMEYISGLRKKLEEGILERIADVRINGFESERVPNTTSVTVPRIEGEAMALNLSMLGFAVSTGSACATGETDPSHVLIAMGISPVDAQGSLRISLGIENTHDEIDQFLDSFPRVVERLRKLSPIGRDS